MAASFICSRAKLSQPGCSFILYRQVAPKATIFSLISCWFSYLSVPTVSSQQSLISCHRGGRFKFHLSGDRSPPPHFQTTFPPKQSSALKKKKKIKLFRSYKEHCKALTMAWKASHNLFSLPTLLIFRCRTPTLTNLFSPVLCLNFYILTTVPLRTSLPVLINKGLTWPDPLLIKVQPTFWHPPSHRLL